MAAAWRAEGIAPTGSAADHLAAGREALAADIPAKTAEAKRHFIEAMVLDPKEVLALAGYVTAFSLLAGEDPDPTELKGAHRLMDWAVTHRGDRPAVLAAYAHLLLSVPSAANIQQAMGYAEQARRLAPGDAGADVAAARARLVNDPAQAAADLTSAVAAGDPRALTLRAHAHWKAGDAAKALADVAQRLNRDADQPEALHLRGQIHASLGAFGEARSSWEKWSKAQPQSAEPVLALAKLAYQIDGDLRGARVLLEHARKLTKDDFTLARVLAHRAAVERAAGKLDAAHAAASEALRLVPASAPAAFQAGLVAYYRNDVAGVRAHASTLGQRGGEWAATVLKARATEAGGLADEAFAALDAMVALSPGSLSVLLDAAGAYARLRAPGKAIALLRRAATMDPVGERGRREIGDYWEGPGIIAKAVTALEKVAQTERDEAAYAFSGAAAGLLVLGRAKHAEPMARRAMSRDGSLAWPRALHAQALLDMRNERAALRQADAAVELDSSDAFALLVRARVLEAMKRYDQALSAHVEAQEANPLLFSAQVGEAMLLLRRGDRSAARQRLERVLQADPRNTVARRALLELGGDG
jgi:tetratricopeptide (TPR) repeat protein